VRAHAAFTLLDTAAAMRQQFLVDSESILEEVKTCDLYRTAFVCFVCCAMIVSDPRKVSQANVLAMGVDFPGLENDSKEKLDFLVYMYMYPCASRPATPRAIKQKLHIYGCEKIYFNCTCRPVFAPALAHPCTAVYPGKAFSRIVGSDVLKLSSRGTRNNHQARRGLQNQSARQWRAPAGQQVVCAAHVWCTRLSKVFTTT
jgi:hypothetical protein